MTLRRILAVAVLCAFPVIAGSNEAQPVIAIIGTGDMGDSLGPLDDRIVIDVSFPHEQGEDGYYVPMLETSSAEMIQQWNPGARVIKTFALQASYVIDDPGVVGGPVTIPMAADDREAKEQIAGIIVEMGLDPGDADKLPRIPETQGEARECPGTR